MKNVSLVFVKFITRPLSRRIGLWQAACTDEANEQHRDLHLLQQHATQRDISQGDAPVNHPSTHRDFLTELTDGQSTAR